MYHEYEASEVIEVGKAEEMILGDKEEPVADHVGMEPPNRLALLFAKYDE